MAKKVEQRYGSMKDFANALFEFLKKPDDIKSKADEAKTRPDDHVDRDKPKGSMERISLQSHGSDGGAVAGLKPLDQIEVNCKCGQRMVAKTQMAGKLVRCPRCADIVQIPGAGSSTHQLNITCRHCGQHFPARQDLAGKVVKCPMCTKPITVPKPGTASTMLPQIEVTCVCGQQFLARYDLAGKRVKCTACGSPIEIPRSNAN